MISGKRPEKQATLAQNNFQNRLQPIHHSALHSSRGMTPEDKPSAGLSLPCGKFEFIFSDKEMFLGVFKLS